MPENLRFRCTTDRPFERLEGRYLDPTTGKITYANGVKPPNALLNRAKTVADRFQTLVLKK